MLACSQLLLEVEQQKIPDWKGFCEEVKKDENKPTHDIDNLPEINQSPTKLDTMLFKLKIKLALWVDWQPISYLTIQSTWKPLKCGTIGKMLDWETLSTFKWVVSTLVMYFFVVTGLCFGSAMEL